MISRTNRKMILAERDMAMVRGIGKRIEVIGCEVVLGRSNVSFWAYRLSELSLAPSERPVLGPTGRSRDGMR